MPKRLNADELKRILLERNRIGEEYTVIDGRIHDPGKFGLQMAYSVYFYQMANEGFADWDEGARCGFKVSVEERNAFAPYLKGRRTVWFHETEQGFWEEE